ncbi:MAG: hypothetical protein V3U57_04390 [Robiginitomaculum sp.]
MATYNNIPDTLDKPPNTDQSFAREWSARNPQDFIATIDVLEDFSLTLKVTRKKNNSSQLIEIFGFPAQPESVECK